MTHDSEYTIRVLNLQQETESPAELFHKICTSLNSIISESDNYYPTFIEEFGFLYSCSVNGGWSGFLSNMQDLSKAFKNLVFYVSEKTDCGDGGYIFLDGKWWMRSDVSPFDQLSGEKLGTELPPTWIRNLMMAYKKEVLDNCGRLMSL